MNNTDGTAGRIRMREMKRFGRMVSVAGIDRVGVVCWDVKCLQRRQHLQPSGVGQSGASGRRRDL